MYGLKHLRGEVTERRDVAPGLWIVRIRPEQKIGFVPGQYVTVGLPASGKLVERPYSMASSPDEPELEFFLEVVPGGKLSPQLYDVPRGGEVFVRPAARGLFHFDDLAENHFMIATVTGVAPFVSMVRRLVQNEQGGEPFSGRVAVLQSASLPGELGYGAELTAYARDRGWLTYVPTVSRIWLDPAWPGERGRAEDVARKVTDSLGFSPASTAAYICGNPHTIRNMEGVLERAGFTKDRIRKENYWPG